MMTTCEACGRRVTEADVNSHNVCVMCQLGAEIASNTVGVDAKALIFLNQKTMSWHEHPIDSMTMEDLKLLLQIVQSEMFERTHGHHPNVDDMLEDQADLARKGVKEDGR